MTRQLDWTGLEILAIWVGIGVVAGLIAARLFNELHGIRVALERANAYNDANEAMVECYHNYQFCVMRWEDDHYVITPEELSAEEQTTTQLEV